MSKEFKFPTEEWQQIKLLKAIAKRDEEWLAEMERWYKEQCRKGYFSSEIWAVDLMDHLLDWAKGEG